ncbi:MAG: HAD-IA family hydrolase [Bacteroidales bacterium]|nr:HAD-IA family hydrolase [Bacteroidales bacterium]
MIKGVLFDMDGVLLDSEEFITRAGMMMFREKGFTVKESDFKPFTGMGENRFLGGVAEKQGIPFDLEKDKARAYAIYEQITRGKLKPLKGVPEFIARCRKKNLKLAVATSADEVKMRINLRETGLQESLFDALVNGLQVEHKKPHPEIYLLAADKLHLRPEECLVVEDALSGMKAAKAAGCKCLAITSSFKAEEFDRADWVVNDMTSVPDECLNW